VIQNYNDNAGMRLKPVSIYLKAYRYCNKYRDEDTE